MPVPRTSSTRWPTPLRALAHRDFRIYFTGQGISTLGKWVQQVALSWLTYQLTGSAFLLGVITFLVLVPQLLVGPLAGAWIDRHDKRKLLIGVQCTLVMQSLSLALLTWCGAMDSTILVLMALLLGILNAFEVPLRQALISSFVASPADLPNALVLNAMLVNAARFIGPPLAGVLIAVSGEAGCFLLTALAFMALLAGLMNTKAAPSARALGSTAEVLREGLHYIWRTWRVRRLMISVVVVNLLASCYTVLLPILAADTYAGNARTLGWLWGAAGAGAFIATLFLMFNGALRQLNRFIVASIWLCVLALLVLAMHAPLVVALLALALLGFGITVNNVSSNMLLQSDAPAELRGRIVAFYISMRFGFEAVGGLLVGGLAAWSGASVTFAVLGGGLLVYLACSRLLARGDDR